MSRTRGRWAITSSKVPCRAGSSVIERGNSSYQAAKPAASRSTSSASGSCRAAKCRSPASETILRVSGEISACTPAATSPSCRIAKVSDSAVRVQGSRAIAASSACRTSASSTEMSTPASCFSRMARQSVAYSSSQASTV